MTGEELCELLRKEVGVDNNSQLAKKFGISSMAVSNLKRTKTLGPRRVANFLGHAIKHNAGQVFRGAITPIVEFFPIENYLPRDKRHYLFDHTENKKLKENSKNQRAFIRFIIPRVKLFTLVKRKIICFRKWSNRSIEDFLNIKFSKLIT